MQLHELMVVRAVKVVSKYVFMATGIFGVFRTSNDNIQSFIHVFYLIIILAVGESPWSIILLLTNRHWKRPAVVFISAMSKTFHVPPDKLFH